MLFPLFNLVIQPHILPAKPVPLIPQFLYLFLFSFQAHHELDQRRIIGGRLQLCLCLGKLSLHILEIFRSIQIQFDQFQFYFPGTFPDLRVLGYLLPEHAPLPGHILNLFLYILDLYTICILADKGVLIVCRINVPHHIALIEHTLRCDGHCIIPQLFHSVTAHNTSQYIVCIGSGITVFTFNHIGQ